MHCSILLLPFCQYLQGLPFSLLSFFQDDITARIGLTRDIFYFSPFWVRDMTDMAAASSRNFSNGTKNIVTLILLLLLMFFLALSQPISGGENEEYWKQEELVLGSRPPQCVKKCLNCSPCVAALVVSQRHREPMAEALPPKDDAYYLVSWKCKCKDKYFQP